MMWDSDTIAQAVAGRAAGDKFQASSVAIDSRTLEPGALFVALNGERVDGHAHVRQALQSGAAGALVNHVPEGMADDAPLIVTQDTHKALADLAHAARRVTAARIIAVTGSVGKTGTKEALKLALGAAGEVYATRGNLNNHIGLPLSLANLPPSAHFGVFELGMNHAGELEFLTRIARPDIAIITNVEAVHLEFFASVEAIADAKAEILDGVTEGGTAILNRDNAYYARLAAKATARGLRIIAFGAHEQAHYRLTEYMPDGQGAIVEAVIDGAPLRYRIGASGRHWAVGSLAVLAACASAGVNPTQASAALAQFHEPEGRGKLREVKSGDGAFALIDDCYNASPVSTEAAIIKLAELKNIRGGRAVAVLGDMLELGASGPSLHAALADTLVAHRIDRVHLAGPLMRSLYDVLPNHMRGAHALSSDALASEVSVDTHAGDLVLIKGSRGSHMDVVRDALLALSPTDSVKASAHAV